MNEVEKMYRNAGISCKPSYVYNKVPILSGLKYPPFTAEKQIFLIHLLSINRIVTIFYENQQIYISVCPNNPHDDRQICECGASWVEVLARVINSYWLLFSEEERTQIKEILSE